MRTDFEKRKPEILQYIASGEPKQYIMRQLKCRPATLNSWLHKWGIKYSGYKGKRGIDTGYIHPHLSLDELTTRKWIGSDYLKKRLYKFGVKLPICEICGCKDWMAKLLVMHLHHIDGNRFNNNLSNLQILCPNCHSQTENYSKPMHKRPSDANGDI